MAATPTAIEVLCLGGATLDRKYRSHAPLVSGSSNPAVAHVSAGGVARNVCETLLRLGARAGLATLIGDDDAGRYIEAGVHALGGDTSGIRVLEGGRTAEYVAVLDADGSLATGLADMAIFDAFAIADLDRLAPLLMQADWAFADCNLPASVLAHLIARAEREAFRLVVDPVSVAKAARLPADLSGVQLLVLNRDEARALTGIGEPEAAIGRLRERGVRAVVLTGGSLPVIVASDAGWAHVPVAEANVSDVTGAGDALIGATLASLLAGRSLENAVRAATRIAALTVASPETVRADLSPHLLEATARSVA